MSTVRTAFRQGNLCNPTATGASDANIQQYTGRETDGTGLQHSRARYYSPTLQRFIREDPLGFGGGDANLYAYVGNDPLNATDPSGLQSLGTCFSAAFGIGTAGTAELCAVITTSGDIGVTDALGFVGKAGAVAGARLGGEWSNANRIRELEGPFATAGGTIGFVRGVGVDTFVGRMDSRLIYGDGGMSLSEHVNLTPYLLASFMEA